MIFSKTIKLVAVILLLYTLPYGIYAQDMAKSHKEKERKATHIEKMENNGSKESGWNKLKFWKKENSHKHQYSVGTNILSWVYFGTANIEINASINNHFSVFAGGKYNPFKIATKNEENEIYHKQKTGYVGAKWWPWFVNTGWWVGVKGQYSDFSTDGILSTYYQAGKAIGGGVSGGYTFMLGRHFNLDIGAGVWGGKYQKYTDAEPNSKPKSTFFKFDNIIVSLTYVF